MVDNKIFQRRKNSRGVHVCHIFMENQVCRIPTDLRNSDVTHGHTRM
uniref:Uncharacterized protein n=1 Tax=Triticum urartu TaxID=4572 RepID=A0A8R7P8T5_TRIUA